MGRRGYKRLHYSWLIAWASAGVLAGVALSPNAKSFGFISNGWLVVAAACFFIALIRRDRRALAVIVIAGLLIGFWRGGLTTNALGGYQQFYNHKVLITGKVKDDTSFGPQGDQQFRISDVSIEDEKLPGTVWASTPSSLDIKRGDLLAVTGHLDRGFGNLPASIHQAEVITAQRPYPGDVGRRMRDWFAAEIRKVIPEPQASLGIGYLVGQKRSLPEDLDEQMRIVGLTHVVVASGYNLTILVVFARRLFSPFSKYLAALTGSILIGGFILITGISPSMSRAGLVAGLGLAAWYYGRVIHPLVLLPFAAALTAIFNPSYLWGDIGWYLSFAAFAGVLVLAPLLNQFFWGKKTKIGILREVFVATISAQIATLPIIMFTFGQYSVYSLPANLLIVPLVPFVMLLTFIAGLSAIILPQLSFIFAAPAEIILRYNTEIVSWLSGLPGAQGELSLNTPGIASYYAVMLVLCVFLWRRTHYNFRTRTATN